MCGEIRFSRVVLVLLCESQSGQEPKSLANAHTAEVVVAQSAAKKLKGIVALEVDTRHSSPIFQAPGFEATI